MAYADPVLSPKGSRTVLDLGCGPGLSSIPLLEHFDRVIGLDPSTGMIDAAQQRLEQLKLENAKLFVNKTVTFEQGFAEDLSKLEAESVDLVIAGACSSPGSSTLLIECSSRSGGSLVRYAKSLH